MGKFLVKSNRNIVRTFRIPNIRAAVFDKGLNFEQTPFVIYIKFEAKPRKIGDISSF